MNALGVLTIMSLLAPGPGPAAPFSILENVDEGNSTTTTTTTAPPPTAAAAASDDVDVTAEISPSVLPQLIRVTEASVEHTEDKLPLNFTPSPELGPIQDEAEDAGRHTILQHGPSPLAAADNESDDLDVDGYSSPGSLTAMAGATALRSRRPLLSPVRTAGLSAYASTPIKFEGDSEHTGDEAHGQDVQDHEVRGQDIRDHNFHDHEIRGHGIRSHDFRDYEIRGHDVRGPEIHSQHDTVVTALRGHYSLHPEVPFNPHISLIAHHLSHDAGVTSSGDPTPTSTSAAAADSGADSGADPVEHHTFPTISSLGDYQVYPTIGAFPYESAKPTGPHVQTVAIAHKPVQKPKELHHKKGWSKHWKTALRMLAGLAPLALLLAALPPNVLIVNPAQYVNRTTMPMHMRGRIANNEVDETLTEIASCRRVCEQVRAALSTVRIGGREAMPGFGDLLEAARSPTCAESLCAPDLPTATTSTTTTTTTFTRHTAIPTPADGEPESTNRLVKKYVKAVKRRKNSQQQQSAGV